MTNAATIEREVIDGLVRQRQEQEQQQRTARRAELVARLQQIEAKLTAEGPAQNKTVEAAKAEVARAQQALDAATQKLRETQRLRYVAVGLLEIERGKIDMQLDNDFPSAALDGFSAWLQAEVRNAKGRERESDNTVRSDDSGRVWKDGRPRYDPASVKARVAALLDLPHEFARLKRLPDAELSAEIERLKRTVPALAVAKYS